MSQYDVKFKHTKLNAELTLEGIEADSVAEAKELAIAILHDEQPEKIASLYEISEITEDVF